MDALEEVLDGLLDERVAEGDGGARVDVSGYVVSRATAEVLTAAAAAAPAGAVVEVGCASGASTLAIVKGRVESGKPGAVHVIDPGQDLYVEGAGRRTIERAGLGGVVTMHERYDWEALPELVGDGVRAGFVFLDGDHRFESVVLDLYYAKRLLVVGGVVALHDLWMPAVRHAAAYWAANLEVELVTARGGEVVAAPYDGGGEGLDAYVKGTTLLMRKTEEDGRRWDSFEAYHELARDRSVDSDA